MYVDKSQCFIYIHVAFLPTVKTVGFLPKNVVIHHRNKTQEKEQEHGDNREHG